jgi:hypothetical protein
MRSILLYAEENVPQRRTAPPAGLRNRSTSLVIDPSGSNMRQNVPLWLITLIYDTWMPKRVCSNFITLQSYSPPEVFGL